MNTPLCESDNTAPIVEDPGAVSQDWTNIAVDAGHVQMGTFFDSGAPIFSVTCNEYNVIKYIEIVGLILYCI